MGSGRDLMLLIDVELMFEKCDGAGSLRLVREKNVLTANKIQRPAFNVKVDRGRTALIVSVVARSTTGCYRYKVLCLGLFSSLIASSKNGSASFPGPVILLYTGGNQSNILSV